MTHKTPIRLRTLKLRKKQNLTQQQLARRADLSKTTISNLESGHQTKIELETIAKLCHALDCTPTDLFEIVENDQNNFLQSQKAALAPFLAASKYDKPFDHNKLDSDLAKIINTTKGRKKN